MAARFLLRFVSLVIWSMLLIACVQIVRAVASGELLALIIVFPVFLLGSFLWLERADFWNP